MHKIDNYDNTKLKSNTLMFNYYEFGCLIIMYLKRKSFERF